MVPKLVLKTMVLHACYITLYCKIYARISTIYRLFYPLLIVLMSKSCCFEGFLIVNSLSLERYFYLFVSRVIFSWHASGLGRQFNPCQTRAVPKQYHKFQSMGWVWTSNQDHNSDLLVYWCSKIGPNLVRTELIRLKLIKLRSLCILWKLHSL